MGSELINYDRWQKVIKNASIGVAAAQFFVEIIVNTLLYINRQQGYNEKTIVSKLIRYLLLTTLFNVFVISVMFLLCRKIKSNSKKKYILTFAMCLICFNVSYSHYQFAPTFLTFSIPLIFTIMYEDKTMCRNITIVNICLLIPAILARASDKGYNADIGPEAIISVSIIILLSVCSVFIIDVLITRRQELNAALVQAEKAKYADELDEKNKELDSKNKELAELTREIFEAIAKAIDINEPYTAGHSRRVAVYARMIAAHMGLSKEDVEEIYYAGLIHDVGKLGIDNTIINKKGKLTDEEYAIIKRHPSLGFEILKGIAIEGKFADGARCHHERIDGHGYPNGLKGEEISQLSRIIAVADAYDAMTSRRSYRDAMPQAAVREQIVKGSGTQFDPEIAKIMIEIIDDDKEYKLRQQQES